MEDKVKIRWVVKIYQEYCACCPGRFSTGEAAERDLNCETFLLSILVSAQTAQIASDMGWEYIEAQNIPNGVVREIGRYSVPEPQDFTKRYLPE